MTYAIKDERDKYYVGMSGIGPMMGGTLEEAVKFTDKSGALEAVRHFPCMIDWNIVEVE